MGIKSNNGHHNKNTTGEFTETCIGVWRRQMNIITSENNNNNNNNRRSNGKAKSIQPKPILVCYGVNLITIKDADMNSVKPSETIGFQVIRQTLEKPQVKDPRDQAIVNPQDDILSHARRLYKQKKDEGKQGDGGSGAVNVEELLKKAQKDLTEMAKSVDYKEIKTTLNTTKQQVYRDYKELLKWLKSFWK